VSLGLYIHIPFCAVRCPYCDFNTYAGLEALFAPYTAALIEDIRRGGASRGRPAVSTVFFGGGTPTVLPAHLLASVMAAAGDAFAILPGAEITSEANPGTTDGDRFAALAEMGVNRLSMGVQSFDDAELRWLGRIHGAGEAEAAFHAARAAGFANINLDFMFGIPGQAAATWERTLDRALALGPEHLSLYSLIVEQGTPLADRVSRGLVPEPDDDAAADLYEIAMSRLTAAGYQHYEISNWARSNQLPASSFQHPASGFQCRHNLIYWRHEPYLGFGAGAHSFDGSRRWWNVKPVPEYIRRVQAGASPEREGETIDTRTAMGELMMVGLRLIDEGVEDARFAARFGVGLEAVFGNEIARLVARGLLERLPGRVRLTPAGRLLGNQVFAEFLAS
jgi:oxygen-independent coproporphyrinogen III oxidase